MLLGAIAAGIWALVLLQAWQAASVRELLTEVYAIGADTQAIHEDLDPAGSDDAEDSATRAPHPRGGSSLRRVRAGNGHPRGR